MSEKTIAVLIFIGVMYVVVITIEIFNGNIDLGCLNPFRNYDEYTTINVFGIIVITLIYNALLLPFAIIYWVCNLIKFLFTVGRK